VLVGAVHETSDLESELDVAVTEFGTPGEAAGTMGADGDDAGPVPRALVAVTVNVYVLPLVSPVTVHVVVEPSGVVQVWPLLDVTL